MYIVKRPLTIGNERRKVGSVVTAEEAPNAGLLERTGYLVRAQEPFPVVEESSGFIIPLMDKDGTEEISMAENDIVAVFSMLQMGAEDAVNAIGEIGSSAALKLLCKCDRRKTVLSAAKARLEGLVVGE